MLGKDSRTVLAKALLFSLGMSSSPVFSAPEKLIIAAFEYPPIYQDKADKGLSGDIAIAAFKAAGVDATLRFYPAARMVRSVVTGETTCGIGGAILFQDPESKPHVVFGDVLQYVSQTFLYDKRKYPAGVTYSSPDQLSAYAIGVLYSSGIMRFLEKHKGLALSTNSSHEGSAKQLASGRIDLWAIVDLTGQHYMEKLFPEQAGYFNPTSGFNTGDVSLVCSLKMDPNSYYLKRFRDGLARIKKDGTYLQIMAKYYGGKDRINRDALPNDMK